MLQLVLECLIRPPTLAELQSMERLYQEALVYYRNEEDQAIQMAEDYRPFTRRRPCGRASLDGACRQCAP